MPIYAAESGYGWRRVAPGAMIEFLARAAKDARKAAGIKTARIAVAADVDPSTIYRFEKGRWPGNADEVIAGYADELDISPDILWCRALEMWRAAEEEHSADHGE